MQNDDMMLMGAPLNGPGGLPQTPGRARDEFIAHVKTASKSIPPDLLSQLEDKQLRLSDAVVYSTKRVEGAVVKLFVSGDDKKPGYSNLEKGKLESGQLMLAESFRLLAGIDTVGNGNPAEVAFFEIDSDPRFAAIQNGEITLKSNRKVIFEKMSCSVFCTAGSASPKGLYKLDNLRFLEPIKDIDCVLDMGSYANLPPNTFIKAEILGPITLPTGG